MVSPQTLVDYSTHLSYLVIFLLPALGGHVVPIPEEIILLLAGYLAGVEVNNIYLTMIVAFLGVLAGDNVLFWLSRHGSHLVDRLKNKLPISAVTSFERHLQNHLGKTIFCGRFIIGLRFLSPVLAGSHRVPWRTFQFYNLLASLIYVPLLVFLGYYFHEQVTVLVIKVAAIRHLLMIVFGIILTLTITHLAKRVFFSKTV